MVATLGGSRSGRVMLVQGGPDHPDHFGGCGLGTGT